MKKTARKKALVIGRFGFESNQIDGQTIKTRNVYELLGSCYDVQLFDTESLRMNKRRMTSLLWMSVKYKYVFYVGAQNNLRYFFPLLFFISKIRMGRIVYVTVGGWLYDFLRSNSFLYTCMVKNIQSVLVETEHLQSRLRSLGIEKAEWIPNFRIAPILDTGSSEAGDEGDNEFKVVFMARVMKEKGVYLLLDFYEKYKKAEDQYDKKIVVDIYGPVNDEDAENFYERMSQIGEGVSYKGVLAPSAIYQTLPDYDVLVLPTYYEGEGFPGTILDAYLCGLPVIATRWKQIPEFVVSGKTGFLINYSLDDLSEKIKLCVSDEKLLNNLRSSAFEKSKEYSPEVAMGILSVSMGL